MEIHKNHVHIYILFSVSRVDKVRTKASNESLVIGHRGGRKKAMFSHVLLGGSFYGQG